MISRSTFLHLRIPFSFFLLPVFLFALSISNNPDFENVLLVFFIMHILIYPASNGYNSYFDKDEGSIGALKNPPEVSTELYYTSLVLDALAIILGFIISWQFALMIFIYGLISKAYSHPDIRLKKRPISSWLIAGLFQGFFSFMACYIGVNDLGFEVFNDKSILFPAFLSSMLLWGSYPMTQIYQHEEDEKRGDITLSLKLGIRGTFHFTAIFFAIAMASFGYFYFHFYDPSTLLIFLISLSPMAVFFGYWYMKVRNDLRNADFGHTMKLNLISALCFNLFFGWLSFASYSIYNN